MHHVDVRQRLTELIKKKKKKLKACWDLAVLE